MKGYLASLLRSVQFPLNLLQRDVFLLGRGQGEVSLGVWSGQDDLKGLARGPLVELLNLDV